MDRGLCRADPMIAVIAIKNDLTLITGNTAHYQRIQKLGHELRLDNWRLTPYGRGRTRRHDRSQRLVW